MQALPEAPARQRRRAAIAIAIFAVAIGSRPLFRAIAAPASTHLWRLSWIALCLVGLRLSLRLGLAASFREMGLRASVGRGIGFGFLASLPMLATLALSGSPAPRVAAAPLVSTALVAPLCEEILFRGYLFLQLHRRSSWSFAAAVAATALAFGLAHIPALAGRADLAEMAGEIGMIAAGGAFYAWLLTRWNDDLWVPIALHGFMNAWCEVYACDEHPGGWRMNAARALTVAAALALTAWHRRRERRSG